MTLAELQQNVDTWVNAHGGYWDKFEILARLTEELGEVSAALQRSEGLRPRHHDVDVAGEMGDLLFTLAALANVCDIELDRSFEGVLAKYNDRDSVAWKSTRG